MLPPKPIDASKLCLATSIPTTVDSGMFLFSHPCQCDLESSNCSGSKGTVTAVRHLLYHGLVGPRREQAAPPRPKRREAYQQPLLNAVRKIQGGGAGLLIFGAGGHEAAT